MAGTTAFPIAKVSCSLSRVRVSSFPPFQSQAVSLPSFKGLKATPLVGKSDSPAFYGLAARTSDRKPYPILKMTASHKVALLGAGRQMGSLVSLFLSQSQSISALNLWDDDFDMKGLAVSLSSSSVCQMDGYSGPSELGDSLKGVDVAIIIPGAPKRVVKSVQPITSDDLFIFQAKRVKQLVEHVSTQCPGAFILIASNFLNSLVPLTAQVLKEKGVYDPKKLFGITTLDVSTAKTILGQELQTNLVDVPVVGGHEGRTSFPLLSKTNPSLINFSDEKMEELAVRIQDSLSLMGSGSGIFASMISGPKAVGDFVESLLRALDGEDDVYEFAYVASAVTELPFFASRVKLGLNGIEEVISELHQLRKYEKKALEILKCKVKADIDKGIAAQGK